MVCNTYLQWKVHIQELLPKEEINLENMLHWLYKNRNAQKRFLHGLEAIVIPIEIAFIQLFNLFTSSIVSIIILLLVIVGLLAYELRNTTEKLNFYNDVIEIIKDIK